MGGAELKRFPALFGETKAVTEASSLELSPSEVGASANIMMLITTYLALRQVR
jgi:hypothetical protein